MRKLNLVLLISIFLFSKNVWAGVEEILGPEPIAPSSQNSPTKNLIGLSAEAGGGIGLTSYTLSSSGYGVSLPMTFSYMWTLSAIYKLPESRFSFYAEYFAQQASFNSVGGASPSTVGVNTIFYDVIAKYDLDSAWSVGLGFGVNQRLSTTTVPRDVISSAISSGPIAMAGYSFLLSSVDELGARLSVFLPNYYDETSTSSGFSNSSFILRLNPYYKKEFKPNVFGSVGLLIEYNFNGFSGTGTRQTVNAREGFWKIFVPLTLGMDF